MRAGVAARVEAHVVDVDAVCRVAVGEGRPHRRRLAPAEGQRGGIARPERVYEVDRNAVNGRLRADEQRA